jgi:hypothetical protein
MATQRITPAPIPPVVLAAPFLELRRLHQHSLSCAACREYFFNNNVSNDDAGPCENGKRFLHALDDLLPSDYEDDMERARR